MSKGVFGNEVTFGSSEYNFFQTVIPEPVLKRKVSPIAFIVMSFLVIILIGSLLLSSSLTHRDTDIKFIDALFTATSATTVTGLVVVDTYDTFNWLGQFIILILIHIGGLGYMTVISFFFLGGRIMPLRQAVFIKEQLNLPSIGDILTLARRIFLTVFIFEIIGALILAFFWQSTMGFMKSAWFGIFHSIAAFNNAGFDLLGQFKGFTEFTGNWFINITIMVLIIIGGIGFIALSDMINAFKKENHHLSLHTKIVLAATICLILFGALLIFLFEKSNKDTLYPLSTGDRILSSLFHSVSARTAGFNTIDISKLTIPTLLVLMLLMFIGASPGGTGGGVKTTSFAVAILTFFSFLKQKEGAEAFNRRISMEVVEKSFLLMFFSFFVIFISVILLTFFDAFEFRKLLFETISAFGTVGLSTGITKDLTSASKLVIMSMMFIGRIGPLTLLSLITWSKRSKVNYLEEQVAIG